MARGGAGRRILRGVLYLACLLGFPQPSPTAETPSEALPHITYSKDFPNSQPAYFAIVVYEDGQGFYKSSPDDRNPLSFQFPADRTAEMFGLAGKLNRFKDGMLESNRKVANTGKKTLIYQNGEERYEVAFNHTEKPDAFALVSMFEKISQSQQHILRLKYLLRFDRLGVVKELLQLESDLDAGRLLATAEVAPLLEQIRNDRALVHVAQERAVQILGKLQTGKP